MIFSKLNKDARGYLFKFLRYKNLSVKAFYCSIIMYLVSFLKGITLGKKVRFIGKPILVRSPESEIIIGDYSSLISDYQYNLAGVNRRCTISTMGKGSSLIIGKRTGISGAVISAMGKITIGDHVLIGANSFISDHDWHNISPEKRRESCTTSAPIVIEDNVWLGLNVIILKGVTVGMNTVIGANSVVTRSIPANVIAAGNPCKVIKQL